MTEENPEDVKRICLICGCHTKKAINIYEPRCGPNIIELIQAKFKFQPANEDKYLCFSCNNWLINWHSLQTLSSDTTNEFGSQPGKSSFPNRSSNSNNSISDEGNDKKSRFNSPQSSRYTNVNVINNQYADEEDDDDDDDVNDTNVVQQSRSRYQQLYKEPAQQQYQSHHRYQANYLGSNNKSSKNLNHNRRNGLYFSRQLGHYGCHRIRKIRRKFVDNLITFCNICRRPMSYRNYLKIYVQKDNRSKRRNYQKIKLPKDKLLLLLLTRKRANAFRFNKFMKEILIKDGNENKKDLPINFVSLASLLSLKKEQKCKKCQKILKWQQNYSKSLLNEERTKLQNIQTLSKKFNDKNSEIHFCMNLANKQRSNLWPLVDGKVVAMLRRLGTTLSRESGCPLAGSTIRNADSNNNCIFLNNNINNNDNGKSSVNFSKGRTLDEDEVLIDFNTAITEVLPLKNVSSKDEDQESNNNKILLDKVLRNSINVAICNSIAINNNKGNIELQNFEAIYKKLPKCFTVSVIAGGSSTDSST